MDLVPLRRDTEWRRSICCYCGTGCGVLVRGRNGVVSEVRGDPDHPVNRGQLCAKGALLVPAVTGGGRLLHPYVRDRKGAHTRQVSWDEAIDRVASTIRRVVEESGPDAVMLYGSGQLHTEDYYLFGKLAKGYLGTNNQDTNSRLCMASAVAAYQFALGVDAPPASYADIDEARTILIVGANVEACHPIVFNRIRARQRRDPDVRVIVIDPRRTRTAELADLHLPVRPGADVALLNTILAEVIRFDGIDHDFIRDHTSGWEAVHAAVVPLSAERAADLTGVDAEAILDAARIIAANGPLLALWTMGANQSTAGVDKNLALINLCLATGNIGRPGGGPFSLTGQPNAMGGREAGGLASALPGHRSVTDPDHRREIETAWRRPPGSIPPRPGLTALEMVEALEQGEVRVVWVAATNPLASLPGGDRVRRAFQRADLVVVQDAYAVTESTQVADVLLPAAQWAERAGTMTNSERRICLLEAVADPPGEALPDWEIICRIARALGFKDGFSYGDVEEVFIEYRDLTRGRDLDSTGIDYDRLREAPGGIQWPCPETARGGVPRGTERLYADHRFPTPDGRARFHTVCHQEPADELTPDFPLALVTGRVKDQWHTMTRTGHVAKLLRAEPHPFIEVHPTDAEALRLVDGQFVRVRSRRGAAELPVRITDAVRPGALFAPFHWGPIFGRRGAVNAVTTDARDPRSKQPELKFAAVRLEPIEKTGLRE